jgi:pimeloyl-ACP methyl ester carboxylesterase
MAGEEAAWAAVPHLYGERTRRRAGQRIAEDVAERIEHPTALLTRTQQLIAAASHDALGRLEDIAAPTLVVHGGQDQIVPVENARLLHERIPGSQLRIWPSAGHLYVTDEPRADREIARFLARHGPRRRLARLQALLGSPCVGLG